MSRFMKISNSLGNVSYMSVNADSKFELHIFLFDRVRAPNVHSYTGIPN